MWKRTVSESWESEKQGRRGFPSLNNERKKVTDKPHLRPLTKNYPDWDTMVGSPVLSLLSPLCGKGWAGQELHCLGGNLRGPSRCHNVRVWAHTQAHTGTLSAPPAFSLAEAGCRLDSPHWHSSWRR